MASAYTALGLNSRGDSVKELQRALNAAGYNIAVDGVFGSQTQAAVKKYQTGAGLEVTGSVDENMWNMLNGVSEGTSEALTSSSILEQLQESLSSPGYTPKTDDQIREQAEGEYKSYYDQLRLSAQQQHEQSDLALQQQREGLQSTYDKQREDSAKQYQQAYSQTDRTLLGRGMQRSSYTAQTLANLLQEGAEAQQDIGDAQAAAEGNIDAQRAQLAQQLAAQLGQYDAAQQSDILARIRELESQEYDRGQTQQNTQLNLALQLYNALYQSERDQISDARLDQQSSRSGSSSSSSSGGSSGLKNSVGTSKVSETLRALVAEAAGTTKTDTWADLFAALNGTTKKQ